MAPKKLYIIEKKQGRKWVPTWWADEHYPSDVEDCPPPVPVGIRKARKALGLAQRAYPAIKYRIAEVKGD